MSPATPRFRSRVLASATGLALLASPLALTAGTSPAHAAEGDGWSYSVTTLSTGITNAYDMAYDPVHRKAYYTDGNQRTDTRTRVATYDTSGAVNGYTYQYGFTAGTGKVVEINTANSTKRNVDYTGLTRLTGVKENVAHSWTGFAEATTDGQVQSQSSLRTHFSPNGIAVDPNTTYDGTNDPTIITTHVRQQGYDPVTDTSVGYGGGIVIWKASQGAPTDADRLWKFDDGEQISDGSRRIAVNSETHKAYIGNFAQGRSADPSSRRGYITVIDLPTKTVDARIAIPAPAAVTDEVKDGGPIGVTVDEANNDVYVGQITQDNTKLTKLFRIDADGLNTSNPKDKTLNASKVVELDAAVPGNARPTYDPTDKRLYVSSYQAKVISVVDADLASPSYGTVIETIQTGQTNSVEVDAERDLLFSANLQDKEVVVYSTETFEELLRLPTSGNVSALAVDPVTHQVWASSFGTSAGGVTDVFTLKAPAKTDVPSTPAPAATSTTAKAPKKVKASKRAKVTVTVAPAAGGQVTVTATKGKKTKTATATVSATGVAKVKLPKLQKGKWKVTATYAGSPTHAGSTSSTVKVKVTK
ncbi:Ig-like domain repeat protein [Nocardioides humi]|nr:Ig-like domain repeat protein [Nocardioides humi]